MPSLRCFLLLLALLIRLNSGLALTAQDDTARPADAVVDKAASGAIDNPVPAQTAAETKPEVPPSFRIALVVLKSDWTTLPNSPAMEQEVNSVLPVNMAATSNFKPLNAGPALAFGSPGWCSRFSGDQLAGQMAWLKKHGLLKRIVPLGTAGGIVDQAEFPHLPVLDRIDGETPGEQTFQWRVTLWVERMTSDFMGGPYWQLRVNRELSGTGFEQRAIMEILDVAMFSIGGDPTQAVSMNLFSLERDADMRDELHKSEDEAVFVVVYPYEEPFKKLFRKDASDDDTIPKYHPGVMDYSPFSLELTGRPRRAWRLSAESPEVPPIGTVDKASDLALPELSSKIDSLKQQVNELEVSTAADAETLRQSSPTDEASSDGLTASVQKLFDLRQQLQSAEAERMRLKLQTIEANFAVRIRNRDRVVQRRVDELLDPKGTATGWNSPVQETLRGDHGIRTAGKRSLLEKAVEPWWLDLTNLLESLRDLKTNSEAAKLDLARKIADLAKARTSRPSDVENEQLLVDEAQELLTVLLSNWKHVWSVYQSQLQVLKLDVDESQLRADAMQAALDRLKDLKNTSTSDLAEAASQQARATIEVKRSAELLRLFADLEKREPQFNPATFGETK